MLICTIPELCTCREDENNSMSNRQQNVDNARHYNTNFVVMPGVGNWKKLHHSDNNQQRLRKRVWRKTWNAEILKRRTIQHEGRRELCVTATQFVASLSKSVTATQSVQSSTAWSLQHDRLLPLVVREARVVGQIEAYSGKPRSRQQPK